MEQNLSGSFSMIGLIFPSLSYSGLPGPRGEGAVIGKVKVSEFKEAVSSNPESNR